MRELEGWRGEGKRTKEVGKDWGVYVDFLGDGKRKGKGKLFGNKGRREGRLEKNNCSDRSIEVLFLANLGNYDRLSNLSTDQQTDS